MTDQFYLPNPRVNEGDIGHAIYALFEQDFIDKSAPPPTNQPVIFHGVHSDLWIKRAHPDTFINGHFQNFVPDYDVNVDASNWVHKVVEEGQSELDDLLCAYLNELDPITQEGVKGIVAAMLEINKKAHIHGYQPVHLGEMEEHIHVDPVKYVTAFLLKLHSELESIGHSSDRYIVFHPDLLFFLFGEDLESIRNGTFLLSELGSALGQKYTIENINLNHPLFIARFGWMQDPAQIFERLCISKNIGLCIDICHLFETHKGNREICRISSSEALISLIGLLSQMGRPLVIHTRDDIDETDPIIDLAKQLGIPVVCEP